MSDCIEEAQGSWKRIIENYRIENPVLDSTVTLQAVGGSLEFSLSYLVDYAKTTTVKDQLFTKIVDEIASSKGGLEWASSSTTVALQSAPADLQVPSDFGFSKWRARALRITSQQKSFRDRQTE